MRGKVLLVVGLSALVAGCSTAVGGSPTPVTSSAASPSAAGSPDVPKVAHPLNTAKFEADPCAALTSAQAQQLGITAQPNADTQDKLGPRCTWNGADEPAGHTVTGALLTAGSSLAKIYNLQKAGMLPYFQPVDVAGYPGVLNDNRTAQPKGRCALAVGIRDDLVYSVRVDVESKAPDYADPCPLAQKMGELAISTMKAGA